MILKESQQQSNFEPIPAGSYAARCYALIDLGTQKKEYMGDVKEKRQVKITWELPTETKVFKEGEPARPFSISKTYTASLFDKAQLRQDLKGWRGRDFTVEELSGFDFKKILGATCLLSVVHQTSKDGKKTWAQIGGISQIPKGMTCPEPVNKIVYFSLDNFDQKAFDGLNKYDKEKIEASPEFMTHYVRPVGSKTPSVSPADEEPWDTDPEPMFFGNK